LPIRKVLITGAAGFIGSHLTEACLAAGYDVRVLIHYNSRNSRGWLEPAVAGRIEVVAGDIRDTDAVYRAVRGVDTIFHLAALIGIPYSYESPMAYVKTNIEGTTKRADGRPRVRRRERDPDVDKRDVRHGPASANR